MCIYEENSIQSTGFLFVYFFVFICLFVWLGIHVLLRVLAHRLTFVCVSLDLERCWWFIPGKSPAKLAPCLLPAPVYLPAYLPTCGHPLFAFV